MHIWTLSSVFIIVGLLFIKITADQNCPADNQIEELRRIFGDLLHMIEKKEVGRKSGWAKLARFLALLGPEQRRQVVGAYCAKIAEEKDKTPTNAKAENQNSEFEMPNSNGANPSQKNKSSKSNGKSQRMEETDNAEEYRDCLEKLFWTPNAQLSQLKRPNSLISKYWQNAKLLEALLKPKDQLVAEHLYRTLNPPGPRGKVDLGVLMELLLLGTSMEELKRVALESNRLYKGPKNPSDPYSRFLLIDQLRNREKRAKDQVEVQTYGVLITRVARAMVQQEVEEEQGWSAEKIELGKLLVYSILELCGNWDPANIPDLHLLLRELVTRHDQISTFRDDFVRSFKTNCGTYIDHMENLENPKPNDTTPKIQKTFSFKMKKWPNWARNLNLKKNKKTRNGELKGEVELRDEFRAIWQMLEITGLLEANSEFAYLARTLKRAKLKGNYTAVQRIFGLHVGVDMFKILRNYQNGIEAELKGSKFNKMFNILYREIFYTTVQNECYQRVEPKILGGGGAKVKKNVRFALHEIRAEVSNGHGEEPSPSSSNGNALPSENGIIEENGNNAVVREGEENNNKMGREHVISEGVNIVEGRENEIENRCNDGREHRHDVEQLMEREREHPEMGREPEMDTDRITSGENTVMGREQEKDREHSDTVGTNTDELAKEQEHAENNKDQLELLKNDKNMVMDREKEKTNRDGKDREKESMVMPENTIMDREREYYEDREHHEGDIGHEANINGDKETKIAIGHILMDRENKMVAEPKNTLMDRENEYGHDGINALSLFKLFIASILKNNDAEEAESSTSSSEWKELVVTAELANQFLGFLVEIAKDKMVRPKWRTLIGSDQCRDFEELTMAGILGTKSRNFGEKLAKIRGIFASIDVNFFKLVILFGINLANFVHLKTEKNEAKGRENVILKWKEMLVAAFNCFPPLELEDRPDHRAIHNALHEMIRKIHFGTTERKIGHQNGEMVGKEFVKIFCID